MPLSAVKPVAMPADVETLRTLANQAFSRTAGAPLVAGNAVRVLRDATENYPVWERAMREARRSIHVEMYIFHRDPVGRRFVALLAERARAGVDVRVVYDWFGCGFGPAFGLFSPLIAAGGQVRPFNPPAITAALGWLRRNHRKLIVIDGRVAFVGGLCIGQAWQGRPEKGQEPWRYTGIEIVGPAVAYAESSFAESWRLTGGQVHHRSTPARAGAEPETVTLEPPRADAIATTPSAGAVSLRLIPTEPFTANLLRLDLLVASLARKSLWITDAYFIGTSSYLEALKRAAADGVDVRLLLPQGSDVGWTVPVSRSLYRPLLEAGVRIFEWNGTMVHAKTAVADSRWSRIGSTNLNINSWLGNWELDVAIEDAVVSQTLEEHYVADLERSTEIVLKTYRLRPRLRRPPGLSAPPSRRHRSARRVVRTVTDVSRSIGAAVTGNRQLEDFEVMPVVAVALVFAAIAAIGFLAPRALAWPLAVIAAWAALTFVIEAVQLWKRR